MTEKGAPNGASHRILYPRNISATKLFAIGALAYLAIFQFRWWTTWNAQHECHTLDGKLSYPGESIFWEVCGDLNGRKLECSEINVPMDQFDFNNSGNDTFSVPLIRLRGKDATKNIILNPGGPGGSGAQLLARKGELLHSIIGEGYHLLTFDPRGINSSKPQGTCYPDPETRRLLSFRKGASVMEDSAETYAWTRGFVQACSETMGKHGEYINTPQTAADMNSILDAVGQQDMVYWGFSYGTVLGQTYATLFPERSKRVIIDGVANNFDWYENPFISQSQTDTENVLLGFFDECIKAGNNCPLSSFAKTKEELRDKVLTFANGLNEPLSVYINNTVWGSLSRESIIVGGLFSALYQPYTWPVLADRLAKLLQGNATEAFLAYGRKGPWDSIGGDGHIFVMCNDGVTGPKHYFNDRQGLLGALVPYVNESLFRIMEVDMYYRRQQWSVPKTHNFVPKLAVKTAHPLLILSTTFDPVCPLISAQSAKAVFEGSQIVELKAYGHCSWAMPSECVMKHVRNFLYNGTLPANHTECEVDVPYFSKDQQMPSAQFEIAGGESWPYVW